MSDFTAVNSAAMSEGISDLQNAYKQLRGTLDDLTGELDQSLANWDGDARETYTRAQIAWNEDCQHMQDVIQKMNVVLGQITEGYSTTENKIASNFGG